MEELISIIVPVYNAEKYLNKCIKSIINQTYKKLEIILIDDGSTDNSGKIIDKWQKEDSRIIVIHKENEGFSEARNIGIIKSKGKYLSFIDNDDYIEVDFIESLYKSIIQNDSQIAAGGYIYETYTKQEIRYAREIYIENAEETLKRMFTTKDISICIWDKLYKRELFDNIKFPIGKIHTDFKVLYQLVSKSNKISHINKAGYHYIQRGGSIMHSDIAFEQLTDIIEEELIQDVKNKYPDILAEAECFWIIALNNYVVISFKRKMYEEHKLLKEKLRQYIPRILKNSKINLGIKLKSILIIYFNGSKFLKK